MKYTIQYNTKNIPTTLCVLTRLVLNRTTHLQYPKKENFSGFCFSLLKWRNSPIHSVSVRGKNSNSRFCWEAYRGSSSIYIVWLWSRMQEKMILLASRAIQLLCKFPLKMASNAAFKKWGSEIKP